MRSYKIYLKLQNHHHINQQAVPVLSQITQPKHKIYQSNHTPRNHQNTTNPVVSNTKTRTRDNLRSHRNHNHQESKATTNPNITSNTPILITPQNHQTQQNNHNPPKSTFQSIKRQ